MKTHHLRVIAFASGFLAGAGIALATPQVDVRFDLSLLAPDFEGRWSDLPVDSSSATAETTPETVVFSHSPVLDADTFREQATEPDNRDPLFVTVPLHPSGRSVVFGVAEAGSSDVVLLDNGQDQGFRNGMICEILREGSLVGEIILVEVRADRSAGLITQLESGSIIRFGDVARIKTVQFL